MNHSRYRLRQWLGRKYARRIWESQYPDKYLHGSLGLIDLAKYKKAKHILSAPACETWSESRMR